MAEHGAPEYATAPGNDYAAHEETYKGFVHLAFVGVVHVVNTVIALAIYGVAGYLLAAIGVFFVATAAAVHGLKTGSRNSSLIALGLALVTLALTAA